MAVFLYSADFNRLWELLENPTGLQFPVEIEWDGCPPDKDVEPVASERWLTPLHWAICLKYKCPDSSVNITFTLAGEPTILGDNPLLKLVCQLHPSLRSWLRLPGDANRQDKPTGKPITARELRDLLFDEFTSDRQASDHHGINNLILPLVLNDEQLLPDATKPADHRYALFSMLCALEVIPPTGGGSNAPEDEDNNVANLPPRTLVYLVDDQAKHGWEQWVKAVVGKRVQRFGHDKFFQVVIDGDAAKAALAESIVLLDLRLGDEVVRSAVDLLLRDTGWITGAMDASAPTGRQLAADSERIKAVFAPARDAVFDPARDNDPDIKKLRDEVTKSRDEELRHPRCLTLPARLFALLYPRTPVVLFSSTQNEQNLSLLREFPNVVTTFNKGTLARAVESDFKQVARSSLLQSIRLAGQLKHISRVADAAREIERGPADESHPAAHAELYLDEYGDERDPQMRAGGCICIFSGKTSEEAIAASHRYNKEFLTSYAAPFSFANGIKRQQGITAKTIVQKFKDSWQRGIAPTWKSRIALEGHEQHDLMVRLVEVFVALSLPMLRHYYSLSKVTFSVFMPTRSKPVDQVMEGTTWPYRFGVGINRDKTRLFLASDDLASKVTLDTITNYAPRELGDVRGMLHQASTVRLAYASGYDLHPTLAVYAVVHHECMDWERLRQDVEPQERARIEGEYESYGWEPDSRALHYLADLAVGKKDGNLLPIKPWSCSGDLDDGARAAIRAAQVMNKAEVGDYESLGRALVELAELKEPAPTVPAQDSLRQLALSNLRRLAGDSWEKVVAAAFRKAKITEVR